MNLTIGRMLQKFTSANGVNNERVYYSLYV